MPGNFSQYGVEERRYSDVEAVQAPVEDTSAATAMSGIANGISAFAQGVGDYLSYDKAQKKAEAAALENEYSNRYDYAIDKMSAAIDSGEMTSSQARAFLVKTKRELISMGASADKLNESEAKSLKTLTGKVLAEGTAEEASQKQFEKDFNASPYNDPEAGEDEQEINKARFRTARSKSIARQEEIDELNLVIKRNEKNASVRKEAEAQLREVVKGELNDVLRDQPTIIKNEVAGIRKAYQQEVFELGEAKAKSNFVQRLERYRNAQASVIERKASQVEGSFPLQHKVAVDNLNKMVDTEIKYVGDAEANKFRKEALETSKLTTQALLSEDVEVQVAGALSDLLGPSVLVGTGIATNAAKSATKTVTSLLKDTPQIIEGSEDAESYDTHILAPNLQLYKQGRLEDSSALRKQVSQILKYSANELTGGADLKAKSLVVNRIAHPDFGVFVKGEKLTGDDISNAAVALGEYQREVSGIFQNFIDEQLGNLSDEEKFKERKRGKFSPSGPVTIDDFDLVFRGGRVMVAGKTPVANTVAKDINSRVSKKLTNVVMANAHLEGTSYEAVASRWIPELWPSMQEQAED